MKYIKTRNCPVRVKIGYARTYVIIQLPTKRLAKALLRAAPSAKAKKE